MGIGAWSSTAASNNMATPVGIDGTRDSPSDVPNWGRDKQASVKAWYLDPMWVDLENTPVFVSATTFTVATDLTATYVEGRRLRMYGAAMGTYYGVITSSTYSAPNTTVVVSVDDGNALTVNLTNVFLGAENPATNSLPPSIFNNMNLLPGGDFVVAPWQQGTTFNSSTSPLNSDATYIIDNHILLSNGNDIVDVTQDTDKSCKLTVQTIDKQFGMVQLIENAKTIPITAAGKVSLLIEAKTTSSQIANIRIAVLAWTGTADAPTKDVVSVWAGLGTDPTFAASYTLENVPSNLLLTDSYVTYRIDNINVDTANTNNLAIFWWVDDTTISANDSINIRKWKLEPNSSATGFQYQTPADSYLDCAQYYYKTFDAGTRPASGVTTACLIIPTTVIECAITLFFPVVMVKTPTVLSYNPRASATNTKWRAGAEAAAFDATFTASPTRKCVQCAATLVGGAANQSYLVHVTADARIGA